MLTPPAGLTDADLAEALAAHWGLAASALAYQAVGFGSHHWEVTDPAGTRWFATVDDLRDKQISAGEPFDVGFGRLRGALSAAVDLVKHGCDFVVAPVLTTEDEPAVRIGDRFAGAVYPFVHGRSFGWGEFAGAEHRAAVTALVVAVHGAPAAVRARALTEDYAIPHWDELETVLSRGSLPEAGPYTRRMTALIAGAAEPIRRLLARHDDLADRSRAQPARLVLTHGEPHPGNTMLTSAGWRLIDWDTALVAPPERDLWSLDPGDGSVLATYALASGVTPDASTLELYRDRWDLVEIAGCASRFSRPHGTSADDDASWDVLDETVARIMSGLAAPAAPPG